MVLAEISAQGGWSLTGSGAFSGRQTQALRTCEGGCPPERGQRALARRRVAEGGVTHGPIVGGGDGTCQTGPGLNNVGLSQTEPGAKTQTVRGHLSGK